MNSSSLARAHLLIEQHRWELAEQELRLSLAEDPNRFEAHVLLALCLLERERFEDATREAETGVHLAPENPFTHYVLSRVFFARNRFDEAERAAREALRLDPFDADYFGWLAQVCYTQRRWQEALDAADQGLAIDGQHVMCVNLRAMALVKLGRKLDAGAAIGSALERDPENAYSHANLGWTLLEQRQPDKALEHFREALRLEPNLEWARRGIIEAMKSRFLVYRLMLMFFLWMMKLSRRAQWWVMLGGYFGYQLLKQVGERNPQLKPWLRPVLIAYIIFAVMTWLAVPLFNLILRVSRFGRLALSREEIRTSDWVGAALLFGVVNLAFSYYYGYASLLLIALMCGLMSFPLSRIYDCDRGWPRTTLVLCTIVMGLLLLASAGLMLTGEYFESRWDRRVVAWLVGLGLQAFYVYCGAVFLMQFVIPIIVQATPRK
ncbi:MAG: tetratricopeptide repeat protein [Planctomycetes bacterium]|nr:tetratricopeptide repeat protein [Planctomycetota bacterium]